MSSCMFSVVQFYCAVKSALLFAECNVCLGINNISEQNVSRTVLWTASRLLIFGGYFGGTHSPWCSTRYVISLCVLTVLGHHAVVRVTAGYFTSCVVLGVVLRLLRGEG